MKQKKLLMAKIDGALVETLPRVGYDRVRGRRELVDAVMKAIGKWEREIGPPKCPRTHNFRPALDGGLDPVDSPPRIRVTVRAGGVVTR